MLPRRRLSMKNLGPWTLVAALPVVFMLARGCDQTLAPHSVDTLPAMEIYFSPRGGCTDAVVREIANAQSSILVQAYSFTSAPIAKALVDAKARGVEVVVILDESQRSEKYSSADFLLHAGITTLIDDRHAIAHNKVIILDQRVVITGSFNFTKAAEESNAENLLVIRDPGIAEIYARNWRLHAEHSQPYAGRKDERKASDEGKPQEKKNKKKTLPLSP
jgi:phosphatidylserine/phosphatidylglycerophosphate/cardiolipin synthase-like enzyme